VEGGRDDIDPLGDLCPVGAQELRADDVNAPCDGLAVDRVSITEEVLGSSPSPAKPGRLER
jgi:hypothetical protein